MGFKAHQVVYCRIKIIFSISKQNQLPDPGFNIDHTTAVVITNPHNDFLSEYGVAWDLVGRSVRENGTIENLERLLQFAEHNQMPVFISPHYHFKHDHGWKFGSSLEKATNIMGGDV